MNTTAAPAPVPESKTDSMTRYVVRSNTEGGYRIVADRATRGKLDHLASVTCDGKTVKVHVTEGRNEHTLSDRDCEQIRNVIMRVREEHGLTNPDALSKEIPF